MENATLGYPSISVDGISFFNSMMEAFNINVDIKNSNISWLIFKAKSTVSKHNIESTSVTMNNSTLGSIDLEGIENVVITNSHFKNPKTNQNGILMDISDCHGFMENISMTDVTSNVGFNIVSNSKLSIKKSEFYGNKVGSDLIKVDDNSSLLMVDCSLRQNDGHAIRVVDSVVVVMNSLFQNNSATMGGAMLMLNMAELDVMNSVFNHNKAESGGAIYAEDSVSLKIKHSKFHLNNAWQTGGAICAKDHTSVILNNGSFSQNEVGIYTLLGNVNSEGSKGGAIYVDSIENITCKSCSFINNTARDQGGAFWGTDVEDFYIVNTLLIDNIASIQEGSLLIAKNTTFRKNTCAHPDKRLRYHSCVDVGKSEVCYNKVKFENNHAGSDGSVMFTERSKIRISNCTFTSTMSEQREDIFLWDNEGKRLCKLWTYISTFQHNNTVVTSNDPDFKQKAFKGSVLRTYSERELNIEEAAYASGKIL